MPKILCFEVKNRIYIGFINSIDLYHSLVLIHFLYLLQDSKIIENYFNEKEKILSKIFLVLLITIFIYSVISLFTVSKISFQKEIIKFRFYLGSLFFVFSIFFLTTIFILIQNCYEKLSDDYSGYNFINILFPKLNKENNEDLKNLRAIYIWFLLSIYIVFGVFIFGFLLKILKFNKENEDDMIVSTWRRRSSLNKELN